MIPADYWNDMTILFQNSSLSICSHGRPIKPVPSLYSCHIEYEYLGKFGDCVDLNTLEDTWYIYPHGKDFSVTKMTLATEEMYFAHRRAIGRPCKPGLARETQSGYCTGKLKHSSLRCFVYSGPSRAEMREGERYILTVACNTSNRIE